MVKSNLGLIMDFKARAVTRDLDWGIPVPVDGGEEKVYMFGLMRLLATYHRQKNGQREKNIDWKPYWQSHDTKLVHFIGKDNIVFHCIIFPIILKNMVSYNAGKRSS